jgi:hypothetical protein
MNDNTPADPLIETRIKGGLQHGGFGVDYLDGANLVELHGAYSIAELEAVARYMREKGARPDGE